MPDEDYRSALLEGTEFEPMPTPNEQRHRHALEHLALLQEAERAVANRSRLAAVRDQETPVRRGLSRDQIFKNLKRLFA